jgi:hypothetical protein
MLAGMRMLVLISVATFAALVLWATSLMPTAHAAR